MSQVTTGARAILSHPMVYEAWSEIVGGKRGRSTLVRDYIRPNGDRPRVLDLGCGPGELLEYLPADVRYVGIDISPAYIARAQSRLGVLGQFRVGDVTAIAGDLRDFDVVVAFGVAHHLDDGQARHLFQGASQALRPEGRAIIVDPTHTPNQGRAARAVIGRDRGQHIREPEGYAALAGEAFSEVATHIRDDLLRIPYTHCVLECRAPRR
jgi:SAM-dependent methyltransferase